MAVKQPVVKWCRMSNYRSRNSHIELPADFFSGRDGQTAKICWWCLLPVWVQNTERFQIKTGTGRDDKNPSASDSVGVHHHCLARGKSMTPWWLPGPMAFLCVQTTHKTCRNQSKAASPSALYCDILNKTCVNIRVKLYISDMLFG